MAQARASGLFSMAETERSTGLWPAQLLRTAVHQGHEIQSAAAIEDDQIQPASLDLRLGEVAYRGPLYAEISPRSFSVLARTGSRLVQLRIRRGSPIFRDTALRRLHAEVGLVDTPADGSPNAETIRNGLAFTVDVSGEAADGIIGWKARRHTGVIDVDRIDYYDPLDFFEPVRVPRGGKGMQGVVLDPNDFYILATREAVVVPPDHAAEMVPYDALVGEFRVHFAGFFDPGFGSAEAGGTGSRGVLEVRSHEVPFLIEHGQIVGRLIYEPLIARPDRLYGSDIRSSYQGQGLALSKHFKRS